MDLIPEDDRNLYTCPEQPLHMSVAMDKFNYRMPYPTFFGGVSAMSVKHFNFINGFSNQFWGWGGEDDDMAARLKMNDLEVTRLSPEIARYTMFKHERDEGNEDNPDRKRLLQISATFQRTDGLENLK